MTVTFQQEPFEKAYRDASEAMVKHYSEIAEEKDTIGPLDPDLAYYRAAEEKGALRILTARDGRKLVGYYVAVVANNKHYQSVLCAVEDMYYLDPEYRAGMVGLRLFLEAEKMMREAKVVISIAKTKVAHDNGRLFEVLKYRPFERVYLKVLEAT